MRWPIDRFRYVGIDAEGERGAYEGEVSDSSSPYERRSSFSYI